jgi:hypothetical protein
MLNKEFAVFIGGNLKNCPSVLSGKSKMNLLKSFPNQNLTNKTWRLFL